MKISTSDHYAEDEYYIDTFTCPSCKNNNVVTNSKFCHECGIKLEWDLTDSDRKFIGFGS